MALKISQYIDLDFTKTSTIPVVHMKQGDELTREITVRFFDNGVAYALPGDVTSVSLSYCKADLVRGCYDHIADEVAYVINTGRTSVTMAIHPQVLTVAGKVFCELKLLDANAQAVLNTFNFVIDCDQSPYAMGQKSEGYWNNVFDGATFTPHVSDAGILSWTNDKNLPNPDPIDLKQFVVDPDDIPVTTMEIVTSEDAAENADADDKLITPAGVKKIVDEYGGDAQNIKVFDLDTLTSTALAALSDNPKTAVFLAYNVANYEESEDVCPYESKLLLLPLTGFNATLATLTATFEQDADLVTYTEDDPPVAVTVRKTVRVTISKGPLVSDPDVKMVEIVDGDIFIIHIDETASPITFDRTGPEILDAVQNSRLIKMVLSDGKELLPSTNQLKTVGQTTYRLLAFPDILTSIVYSMNVNTSTGVLNTISKNNSTIKLPSAVTLNGTSYDKVNQLLSALVTAVNGLLGGGS